MLKILKQFLKEYGTKKVLEAMISIYEEGSTTAERELAKDLQKALDNYNRNNK
jgi:hypothetical protein